MLFQFQWSYKIMKSLQFVFSETDNDRKQKHDQRHNKERNEMEGINLSQLRVWDCDDV